MLNYDMHIHTEYCGHAHGMTVKTICEQTKRLGLDTIAITDHVFSRRDLVIIDQIRKEVAAEKPPFKVIIGAEVDIDSSYISGRLVTDDLEGIDYVIAGFHFIPKEGFFPLSPEDNTSGAEKFLKNWRSAMLGVAHNPKVHTIAHPARLAAVSVDLDLYFEDILAIFGEVAEVSAKNNVAWEINELSGTRISPYYQQQWHRIYQIALDADVKLTYGSDAHHPSVIGCDDFVQMVLSKLPPNCLTEPEELLGV